MIENTEMLICKYVHIYTLLFRNGVAYLDGDIIMEKKESCVTIKETCSVEEGAGVVIRTINNTCCGGIGSGQQVDTGPVQWYNFLHTGNGSYLDISSEGEILLMEGGRDLDSQKWRLFDGELLNKEAQGKALGVDSLGKLVMVDQSSGTIITSLMFEDGGFQLEDASYNIQVANNGKLSWTHNLAKRGAISADITGGKFKMLRAGNVECPELDGVVFRPFQEMTPNTQCWEDNEPTFKLFHGSQSFTVANTKDHLKTIKRSVSFSNDKIPKLVVLIHGYRADADSWPKEMAKILTDLGDPELYVLTVDWKEGAETSWELGWSWSCLCFHTKYDHIYGRAAANTR